MASPLECEIAIVGAGAAGLWAAGRAARAGRDVLLLEKTPRTGTKVLASGGTHCNLTTTLDARAAGELFGPEGARFLAPALRALSPHDLRSRFAELGVETVEAPLEKVFPKTGRARDVRDALEREARAAGARLVCDAGVLSIARSHSVWRAELHDGRSVVCRRLILCPGGMSYPRAGTTGDGYRWLADLRLPIVEPVPALVPLSSGAAWVHELTGIAMQDVEVKLRDRERRACGARRRPLLFTHRGVSGPGAMDLSVHVARAEAIARKRGESKPEMTLEIDLLPDIPRETLRDLLIEAAGRRGAPTISRVLPTVLPRRLVQAVAHEAGLAAADPRAASLDRAARHRLVESVKSLAVPIDGTLGFDAAEVTAGGLALTQVDSGTMRVRGCDGLYVCGELLDLAGPIGGLNFQAAFATAELAARDAAR
jgi:predicted Rossmann fold flavoprotein